MPITAGQRPYRSAEGRSGGAAGAIELISLMVAKRVATSSNVSLMVLVYPWWFLCRLGRTKEGNSVVAPCGLHSGLRLSGRAFGLLCAAWEMGNSLDLGDG